MPLIGIKVSQILQWQNTLELKPKTIINYRSTLNLILKYAYHDDHITKNPMEIVKAPKKIRDQVKTFTIDEMQQLIQTATGQLKNLLIIAFFQGLRGSELIALKWSKVDLFDNNMTIDERIREGETDQTKSKRVRVIDILPPVQNALLNQYQITNDSEYLFLTQYGKPYDTPDALRESLKTLCKQANVKHGTFQTIRATCNTLYKQYGMPNDWILHQIGHLEDKVNQDHYTGKIQADLSKFNDLIPP